MDLKEHPIFTREARSNASSVWGTLAIEVLARLGLRCVVISPGSRSTPLALAAARNPKIEGIPILDERSAAFFALGLAKRSGHPVALVCTSGTAAANYLPAVVEASMSGVPLLLLTADRPPELRDCAAGQTIDQLKLYGNYVRSFRELAVPETSAPRLAYLRQSLVHAVDRCLVGDPGPVHLNVPFRDPLAPNPEAEPVIDAAALEALATVVTRSSESVRCCAEMDAVAVERLLSHRHGLIVVGDVTPPEGGAAFAASVGSLATKLGWPVLADVLNPLRRHAAAVDPLIVHYDAMIRNAERADLPRPSAILQIGPPPTSKVLRHWLEAGDAVSFLLSERPFNTDPLHRVAIPLRGSTADLAAALPQTEADATWLDAWRGANAANEGRIASALEAMDHCFEGKAAWILSRALPPGTPVCLAGSMSVRYAEWFWSAGDGGGPLLANRGANGIDGTLGTALGLAHGAPPAVLLTGDLAFLHDANALLAGDAFRGSLTVVLMNNRGGGIFEHLPVAALEDFEPYFATPQTVDIAGLCRAHGVRHELCPDWRTFEEQIRLLPSSGIRVLEIVTDRKRDVATSRALLEP